MTTKLRLSRLRAGVYADHNNRVLIEHDGDAWVCVIAGSWATTERTKAECVAYARHIIECAA